MPSYRELNELQENIMSYVSNWAREKKTPVSRASIIAEMEDRGVKSFTTINAIYSLQKKGYIRKTRASKFTSYTQLRGV